MAGRAGERAAERFLLRRGWRIVARNWHGGGGEIDIAATRRGVLAVCEVRLRGDPAARDEPVTAEKRRRVARAAEAFLAARPALAGLQARLDVLVVEPAWPMRRVRQIPAAFDAPEAAYSSGKRLS
jgi:putative endonuclease